MILYENKLKNACASVLSKQSIHTAIIYYEFLPKKLIN